MRYERRQYVRSSWTWCRTPNLFRHCCKFFAKIQIRFLMFIWKWDNVRLMSLTILTFLYSFKLLLLVVIKKSKYKFWKTAIYLSKLEAFIRKFYTNELIRLFSLSV
jgi:hypothetical protein